MTQKPRLYRIFENRYGGRGTSGKSQSENKDMMDELITLPLAARGETYEKKITWKELSETKGLLPDDEIHDIDYIAKKGGGFGWMGPEEPPTYYIPHILVSRRRMETDDEYVARIREIQKEKDQVIKNEKELYLKLHAKYGIGSI
jgi:hypothetical protein